MATTRRVRAWARRLGRRVADPSRGPDKPAAGVDAASWGLLQDSPLFDPEWYARVTGCDLAATDPAVDYLTRPVAQRPDPHPLFLRDFVRAEIERRTGEELGGRDPLLVYLRRGLRFPTHPLFDLPHYVASAPGARRHPRGAFGHYLEADPTERGTGVPWLTGPGLAEWVVSQHDAWQAREPAGRSQEVVRGWLAAEPDREPASSRDEVVVVVEAGQVARRFRESLESLAAQSHTAWRVVVVDTGLPDAQAVVGEVLGLDAWRWVASASGDRAADLGAALRAIVTDPDLGERTWIAFLRSGETWAPQRLSRLLGTATTYDADVVCDVLEEGRPDLPAVLLGQGMPAGPGHNPEWTVLSRLLVGHHRLAAAGVPPPSLGRGWEFELVSRLAEPAGVRPRRTIGVRRQAGVMRVAHRMPTRVRPRVAPDDVPTGAHEVLGERLVDWEALAIRPRTPDLTSVVIPTWRAWDLTTDAVSAVLDAADAHPEHGAVEVVVVDNGSGPAAAAVIAALARRDPRVRVVHEPTNLGFALGCNVGFAATHGDVVVFLNDDTVAARDWLGPLRAALEDPAILGVQPLLTYPTGTIQCAGVVLPRPGGVPYPLLQGFPTLDAAHLEAVELSAITGAAMALRAADVVALRGFDPVFLNGMEDVDLCRRLVDLRSGHFACRPQSRVVHHESRTPGRLRRVGVNRRLYLERWGHLRGDDVAAWDAVGYDVHGHEAPREGELPRETWTLVPLLTRRRADVSEQPPRLRWAIKNPAPALGEGDTWGDTYFAAALARALRDLGQEVVVDRRSEHDRASGRHDDVELVLRGLAPYRPNRTTVSLCWVISHPDLLSLGEAALYDRVLAASPSWAQEQGERWGIRIDPLLQATDPELFHPDLAVPDTGHPVLFVGGGARRSGRPLVAAAVERGVPVSIYGPGWADVVDRRHVKGDHLPNDQLGAAYRSAGVVLNDHWADMRDHGFVSNRLFDAVAAGARVVSDAVPGLPEAFGRSVQVVSEPDDLVHLTSLARPDDVFGSDAERRSAAAQVARDHSFEARAGRLVDTAVEARRARGTHD